MDKKRNNLSKLRCESDVRKCVTSFMKKTGSKDERSNNLSGQIWGTATEQYLTSLIFYLLETAAPEEQNFEMVGRLIRNDQISDQEISRVEMMMDDLEAQNQSSHAVMYYKAFHNVCDPRFKSKVQIVLLNRIQKYIRAVV